MTQLTLAYLKRQECVQNPQNNVWSIFCRVLSNIICWLWSDNWPLNIQKYRTTEPRQSNYFIEAIYTRFFIFKIKKRLIASLISVKFTFFFHLEDIKWLFNQQNHNILYLCPLKENAMLINNSSWFVEN